MVKFVVFFTTHLLLPLMLLVSAVAAVIIGRWLRLRRGQQLVPPAIESARPSAAATLQAEPLPGRRGKRASMLRFPGSSAAAQRRVVSRNRVGR